ncbi:hypothetical protein ACOSQ2_031897 [Xanthoceras sorbifolium]
MIPLFSFAKLLRESSYFWYMLMILLLQGLTLNWFFSFRSAFRVLFVFMFVFVCSCLIWKLDYKNHVSMSPLNEERTNIVTEEDLEHLWKRVEVKDGGPSWIHMMDRSTQTMNYQAWRRDPKTGPSQYRSRTLFEDATPEIVRDFFWDDAFRLKWDDILAYSTTIEERVDLYYSSWCIRAAESRRGNGQLTACEVLLFHHEDMGIPSEIAKLGIRQGMWGAVKKIEPGLRAYQKERASGVPLSRLASMAQINTKINPDYLRALEGAKDLSKNEVAATSTDKPQDNNIPKLLVLGGAIILACSLDGGLLPKAFIFSVARRFANMGKKL